MWLVGLERFLAELNLQSHTVLINFHRHNNNIKQREEFSVYFDMKKDNLSVEGRIIFLCEEDKLKI